MLDDLQQVESFMLERTSFHAKIMLDPIAKSFMTNMRYVQVLDYQVRAAVGYFESLALKGDTTSETKQVEHEYQFQVFRTWYDHLKYDIREHRILGWLPVRWTKRLQVQYQSVVKKRSETVPVTVTRFCPHADMDLSKSPHVHLRFLRPFSIADIGGTQK